MNISKRLMLTSALSSTNHWNSCSRLSYWRECQRVRKSHRMEGRCLLQSILKCMGLGIGASKQRSLPALLKTSRRHRRTLFPSAIIRYPLLDPLYSPDPSKPPQPACTSHVSPRVLYRCTARQLFVPICASQHAAVSRGLTVVTTGSKKATLPR